MTTKDAHFFGFARGRISQATARKVSLIAAKHDAFFTSNHSDSGGQQSGDLRSYFGCQNRGAPFDQATAEAVEIALKAEGLWPVPTIRPAYFKKNGYYTAASRR